MFLYFSPVPNFFYLKKNEKGKLFEQFLVTKPSSLTMRIVLDDPSLIQKANGPFFLHNHLFCNVFQGANRFSSFNCLFFANVLLYMLKYFVSLA